MESKCNHIYIYFFEVRKYVKITSVEYMTKPKRRENLWDMLQRLTKLKEYDICLEGRVEVNDGQQFLEKLL